MSAKNLLPLTCLTACALACTEPGLLTLTSGQTEVSEEERAAASPFPLSVKVTRDLERYIQPQLFGLNIEANDAPTKTAFYARFGNGATEQERAADGLARLKSVGFRYLRYPGGCTVDGWDWRNSQLRFRYLGSNIVTTQVMPVQDLVEVASDLGARFLIQVNLDVRGEPNACGWTSEYPAQGLTREQRQAILLEDARELARTLASGDIELGNEQWGPWPTEDYAAVALTFARAMKEVRPSLQIYLAGHASTGSNTNPGDADGPKDKEWTAMVQRLLQDTSCTASKVRCFAGATDHPYGESGYHPFLDHVEWNFRGMSTYLPIANGWIYDKRVRDYAPRNVAVSEWNLRCWTQGNEGDELVRLTNPSFEFDHEGWAFSQRNAGTGSRSVVTSPVYAGQKAERVVLSTSSGASVDSAQVAQTVARPGQRVLTARANVHAAHPEYARVVLEQANAGPHQGAVIAEASGAGLAANQWRAITASGTTFADTTQVRFALRVEKTLAQWQADPTAAAVVFDVARVRDTTFEVAVENGSFEDGKAPWVFWERNAGTGSWAVVAADARDGAKKGKLDLATPSGAALDSVQVSQPFAARPARWYRATAYVKTTTPAYGALILQQRNAGAHQWHHLAETALDPIASGAWQGVMVTGQSFDDTTEVQVLLRLDKSATEWTADPSPASLSFDLVRVSDVTSYRPPVASVQTAEHGLFALTAQLEMARAGVFSSTYHCSLGRGCGVVRTTDAGVELAPAAQGLSLNAPLAGGKMLATATSGLSWTLPPSPCTKQACLPGGLQVPYASGYAAFGPHSDAEGRPNSVQVYLINRHPTRRADATVDLAALGTLNGLRSLSTATLSATSYTDEALQSAETAPVRVTSASPLTAVVEPKSAVRLTLSFEKTFDLTLRATCADGSLSSQTTQGFWALWPSPEDGLEWNLTSSNASQKSVRVVSRHVWNNLYVGLTNAAGQALVPRTPLPHSSMSAGQWFDPSTWMVSADVPTTPNGTYVLDYAATAGCP